MKDKEKCIICHKDITNELPKIDVDGNHYCNDCYLAKCKKELEAKAIEEMANFIHRTEFVDISRYEEETIAKELLKHYQPKLPKDSVVLTKSELEQVKEQAVKEFATILKVKTVLTPGGWCVNIEDIDNTLKEVIGEKE